jgi:hypothetical protein
MEISGDSKEARDRRKCATGLFDLTCLYWPMFMDNYHHCTDRRDGGCESTSGDDDANIDNLGTIAAL